MNPLNKLVPQMCISSSAGKFISVLSLIVCSSSNYSYPFWSYSYHRIHLMYCLGTGVRASGEFAHTYCTCQNCKIIGKVKMETTGM